MRESKVERRLKERCNARGRHCWKFVRPGRRAAFDRIVPINGGRVIWVETKRTDAKLSDAQLREKKMLQALGHTALCINSVELVEKFEKDYLMTELELQVRIVFAGLAMQAMLRLDSHLTADSLAEKSFIVADAMMREAAKAKKP